MAQCNVCGGNGILEECEECGGMVCEKCVDEEGVCKTCSEDITLKYDEYGHVLDDEDDDDLDEEDETEDELEDEENEED